MSIQNFYTIISSFLVICALALIPGTVHASHVVGGSLTYTCLGNNLYEVTVEFRRDCFNGAPNAQFDDPASIGIFDGFGIIQIQLGDGGQLLIPKSTNDTLNEILTSECNVLGEDVCVHTTTYRDTVLLPFNPNGYYLVYQRCCRNRTLSNIIDPTNTGATYLAYIGPEAQNSCNSAPTYKDWPSIYICSDEKFVYDHSAVDPDGDSLVYELCIPYEGATDPDPMPQPPNPPPYDHVTLHPSYSVDNFLGGNDPLTIDPHTGILSGTPEFTGQFLVGVCVKEYRNGILIGEYLRDFELNVRLCGKNPIAEFTALIDSNGVNSYVQCNSLIVGFANNSSSNYLPAESLDYLWLFDYPNTDLTSTEMDPVYTFPEPGFYTVALITSTPECSDTLIATVGVSTVDDPNPGFTYEAFNCNEGTVTLFLNDNTQTVQDVEEYNWTVTADGRDTMLTGPNVSLEISSNQQVDVFLEVITESDCNGSEMQTLDIMPLVFEEDFDNVFVCTGTNAIVIPDPASNVSYTFDPQGIISLSSENQYIISGIDSMYEIAIMATDGFCTYEEIITAGAQEVPEINLPDITIQCGIDLIELNPENNASYYYEWQSPEGITLDNPTATNPVVTLMADGDFPVTISADGMGGCEIYDTVSVHLSPYPILELSSDQLTVCDLAIDELFVLDPHPELSYVWSNASGDTISMTDKVALENIGETTTIYISATNNDNCITNDSVYVTVSDFLDMDLENSATSSVFCEREIVTLAAITNISAEITWTDLEGNTIGNGYEVQVQPSDSISYIATAIDSLGCVEMDTLTIIPAEKIDLVTINSTVSNVFCQAIEVTLSASSTVSADINWLDANGDLISMMDTIVVTPEATTTYIAQATDIYGCIIEDTIIINPAEVIDLGISNNIIQNTFCENDEVILIASSSVEADRVWLNPNGELLSNNDTLVVYPESGQMYIAMATDPFGCEAFDTVTITPAEVIDLDISTDIIQNTFCENDEVTLIASSSVEADRDWLDANGELVSENDTLIIYPDLEQTYIARATDPFGCNAFDTVTISPAEVIDLDISTDIIQNTFCENDEVILIASSTVEADRDWLDANGELITENDTLIIYPDTEQTYIAMATDPFGCEVFDTVTIHPAEVIDLDISTDIIQNTFCENDEVILIASSSVEADRDWLEANGELITENDTLIIYPDTEQTYIAMATDPFGCEVFDTITITPAPKVTLTLSNDVVSDTYCDFDNVTLIAQTDVPADIIWLDESGALFSENDTVTIMPEEAVTFISQATDQYGCVVFDTMTITPAMQIDLTLQSDVDMNIFCEDALVTLFATNNADADIIWYDSNGNALSTGDSLSVNPIFEEEYTAIATDMFGCMDTATIDLIPSIIDVELIGDDLICYGDEGSILASNLNMDNMLSFTWTPTESIAGSNTGQNIIINPEVSTTYDLFIVDENGCLDTLSFDVQVEGFPTPLEATADPDDILLTESTQLDVTTGAGWTYEWSPADILDDPEISDPVATPEDELVTFTVTVTDAFGCSTEAFVNVVVVQPNCDETDIFVPNMFTPNDDNLNDYFKVESNFIESMNLVIYNRWGEKVFESNNQNPGWDGTFENSALEPDVFGYYLNIICINGESYVKQGNVSLVK